MLYFWRGCNGNFPLTSVHDTFAEYPVDPVSFGQQCPDNNRKAGAEHEQHASTNALRLSRENHKGSDVAKQDAGQHDVTDDLTRGAHDVRVFVT